MTRNLPHDLSLIQLLINSLKNNPISLESDCLSAPEWELTRLTFGCRTRNRVTGSQVERGDYSITKTNGCLTPYSLDVQAGASVTDTVEGHTKDIPVAGMGSYVAVEDPVDV